MLLLFYIVPISAYLSLPLTSSITKPRTPSSLQKDVRLYDEESVLYSAYILIGNPPQNFRAGIDTTRSQTWLESSNCKTCEKFEHEYNPEKSHTFKDLNQSSSGSTLKICTYFGKLSSDFIVISTFTSVSSARINFTLATSEYNCSSLDVDGILSFSAPSYYSNIPIVQVLKNTGEIKEAVFGLFINNFTLSETESFPEAALEIGGFNLSYYSSDPEALFYLNTTSSSGTWDVNIDNVQMGIWTGGPTRVTFSSTQRYVIGDLNAYLSFLPYLSLLGFECEEIPKNFVIKCKKNSKLELPEFKFIVGENSFILPSYSIWDCDSIVCTLKIQFNMAGSWILGQIFLENYFTIYNYDNSSIGFAPAAKSRLKKKDDDSDSSSSTILTYSLLFSLLII